MWISNWTGKSWYFRMTTNKHLSAGFAAQVKMSKGKNIIPVYYRAKYVKYIDSTDTESLSFL